MVTPEFDANPQEVAIFLALCAVARLVVDGDRDFLPLLTEFRPLYEKMEKRFPDGVTNAEFIPVVKDALDWLRSEQSR